MLCPTRGDEAELVPPTPNRPPDRASGSAFIYMASARFPSRFGSQKLETAAERRRSDLKRDEGRFRGRRTHSVQTGPLVTIKTKSIKSKISKVTSAKSLAPQTKRDSAERAREKEARGPLAKLGKPDPEKDLEACAGSSPWFTLHPH